MNKDVRIDGTPEMPYLPIKARRRLDEAAVKARPLCDALARLEEAIYETFDDAYWAVTYGEATMEQYLPWFNFYNEDAIEAARERWEEEGGGLHEPEEVPMLIKLVVDLLTKRK